MPKPPDDDDDDLELELEPVDPEILAMEQERGRRKTEEAVARVDIDEILDKQRDQQQSNYDVDWSRFRALRFTTRHLLILTAILAIGLTLKVQLGGCMALFVMGLTAIGAGWYVVALTERRETAERRRIREEFYAAHGAKRAAASTPQEEGFQLPSPAAPRREFRFAFSLKEMFITMTIAAVMLGLLFTLGPKVITIALGAIALVGLAVQTFGWFDPPPAIVLGWWLLLMLYLLLGLLTAFGMEIFGP
jgi:hypothetical protein